MWETGEDKDGRWKIDGKRRRKNGIRNWGEELETKCEEECKRRERRDNCDKEIRWKMKIMLDYII